MEKPSIPSTTTNKSNEAILDSLLEESKKASGEASLESLLEVANLDPEEAALEALFFTNEDHVPEDKPSVKKQEEPVKSQSSQSNDYIQMPRAQVTSSSSMNYYADEEETAKRAHMLIVHSDSTQLSVFEMSFISEGYKVTIFDSGKEALNYLKKHDPDIMILDADIKPPTGMDISRRIRKIDRFETVPVIILTDAVDDRTETMVKMCYANDFFPKTSKIIELKAKARKLMEGHEMFRTTDSE